MRILHGYPLNYPFYFWVQGRQSRRMRESELVAGVRRAYSKAADDPDGDHPFPMGRAFAESVGYPAELLERLSPLAVEAFAGVSNLSLVADVPPGSRVLDLGCGAGLDTLVAAERTGPTGEVVGVDFSRAMLARARAATAGVEQVRFVEASAHRLPLDQASVDVALVNGLFNLNPHRGAIFAELARVLRPGGVVFVAELILAGEQEAARTTSNWFA